MSIETELALLANTKESLRAAIGLSTSIPFRLYAANIPWGSDAIPATGTVFDFQKNRYAQAGIAVYLDDASEFIRLSSATKWQDWQLFEVANNIPRISSDGLLIEPQRTNLISNSRDGRYGSSVGVVFQSLTGLDGVTTNNRIVAVGAATNRFQYDTTLPIDTSYVVTTHVLYTSINKPGVLSVTVLVGTKLEGSTSAELGVSKWGDTVLKESYSFLSTSGSQISRLYFGDTLTGRTDVGYWGWQLEAGTKQTSLIYTTGTTATRSPDILNIPILPTQTITGDWDAGVTYSLAGGIATFTGHGYIRNIVVEEL